MATLTGPVVITTKSGRGEHMKALAIGFGLFWAVSTQAVTWGEFLRGHWVTECKRVGITRFGQTGYTFSDFAGTEFPITVQTFGEYADDKCKIPLQFGQNLGGLVFQGQMQFDPNSKGVKVRWQVQPLMRYLYSFYTRKKVDELNQRKYCGHQDWEVGKAKDLLKSECGKELLDFYEKNWFGLEVLDVERLRLWDQSGNSIEIKRSAFKKP